MKFLVSDDQAFSIPIECFRMCSVERGYATLCMFPEYRRHQAFSIPIECFRMCSVERGYATP
jgi:hypothetical protein